MAATVTSKTKDFARGLLWVQIDDGHGCVSPHSFEVLNIPDIDAAIESVRVMVEQQADAKAQIFDALGMGAA